MIQEGKELAVLSGSDRLSLIGIFQRPSVSTSAIPIDKIGILRKESPALKKGASPWRSNDDSTFFVQKDIRPLCPSPRL